jgi:ABC-type multidrug transport system ATPase subunit
MWRGRVSYVFDDGGTIHLLTVEEQLHLQCALCGLDVIQTRTRTERMIELFDLEPYRHHRSDELSAGLRKRLGLAIGITRDADMYLFDEPFRALDVQTGLVFRGILTLLQRRNRIVLIATHWSPLVAESCTRLWHVADGTVEDLSDRLVIRRVLDQARSPGADGTGAGGFVTVDIPWIAERA